MHCVLEMQSTEFSFIHREGGCNIALCTAIALLQNDSHHLPPVCKWINASIAGSLYTYTLRQKIIHSFTCALNCECERGCGWAHFLYNILYKQHIRMHIQYRFYIERAAYVCCYIYLMVVHCIRVKCKYDTIQKWLQLENNKKIEFAVVCNKKKQFFGWLARKKGKKETNEKQRIKRSVCVYVCVRERGRERERKKHDSTEQTNERT